MPGMREVNREKSEEQPVPILVAIVYLLKDINKTLKEMQDGKYTSSNTDSTSKGKG